MSSVQCHSVPGNATPAGHYSHVAVAQGLAFVAGQLPIRPDGTRLVGASFDDQARQVLANVDAALAAAGSSREHLAQVRVYVTDIGHWGRFNEIYAEWIGPVHRPARAVVPVPLLHHGLLIEVEAVGVVGWVSTGT
jgi:2-iminobutanoate/2-iminopropanoate deaminase